MIKAFGLSLTSFLATVLSVLAITGCDLGTYNSRIDKAEVAYKPTEAANEAGGNSAAGAPTVDLQFADVAGKWELDFAATAKASRAQIKAANFDLEAYLADFENGVFEFDLEDDGSFTADESLQDTDAEYKGNWVLSGGDLIRLNQTHKDGAEEPDQLTGAVVGNRMNLVHKKNGIELPICLKRIE